jgi:transposase
LLTYVASIPLSTRTLVYLSDLLRARRNEVGSRWRRLDAGRQALLVLAHLRNGGTYSRLATGFGIGIATVYRYIREAVDLLAEQAPSLNQVIASCGYLWYLILDGTLIRIDRVAEDRPYYSGKHKRHGVNVQVLADPRGRVLWASPALPGSTHDLTAARQHGVVAALVDADAWAYADLAYQGAGPNITVPFRRRPRRLSRNQRVVNRNRARNRAPGERAVATLKTWKVLTKLRCCPRRATAIVHAILVLHHIEHPPFTR